MKNSFFSFAFFFLLGCATYAQRGLTKIHDTAGQAQLDAFVRPEGDKINLLASEPVVRNPVHINWDSRGR